MVVGWAMAEHMRAELVLEALKMSLYRRRLTQGSFITATPVLKLDSTGARNTKMLEVVLVRCHAQQQTTQDTRLAHARRGARRASTIPPTQTVASTG
jgi:hypothetical protein